MSKKVRNLILSLAVVLVLGGALALLLLLPKNNGEDNSSLVSTIDLTVELVNQETKNVNSIQVKNAKGEYTVSQIDDDSWQVKDIAEFKQDDNAYTTMVADAAALTADRLIAENPDNLKEYGLSEPSAEVSVTYKDKSVFQFSLGNTSPSSGRYIYINEKNAVYLAPDGWGESFLKGKTQFIDKTVTEAVDYEEKDQPDVTLLQYTGSGMKKPIIIKKNPKYKPADESSTSSGISADSFIAEFIMVSPYEADMSLDQFPTVINSYYGITATDIAAVNPTAADLKKFGLDKPQIEFKMVIDEKPLILNLGNESDGCYYVRKGNEKLIYLIDKSVFSFKDADLSTYLNSLILTTFIDDVKEVNLQIGDKKYVFALSGTGDDLVVRYNGNKISTENFRTFYQLMLSVSRENLVEQGQYKGDPYMTFTYVYRDKDKTSNVISFIPAEVRKYLVRLNGKDAALIRALYVDKVATEVENLIAGKTVNSDY